MNEKTKLQSLFVAILLIVLGIISPSNGVDDSVYRIPSEMLLDSLFAIILGTLTFVIYKDASKVKIRMAQRINRQN